ncbi:MAG: ubiquinol-cytochrome c reductase iron-sulfur subunit [Candidatus Latescibacterota bacterium]
MSEGEYESGEQIDQGRRLVNIVLGTGMLAWLGSVVYPLVKFVLPPVQSEAVQTSVVAAGINELGPNEGKIFRFGNKPGLLIRLSTGEYRAFSAVCGHLQCTVQYRSDMSQIWCACHNGTFNLNGEVLSGPPPTPLERYEVAIRGDEILVSKG